MKSVLVAVAVVAVAVAMLSAGVRGQCDAFPPYNPNAWRNGGKGYEVTEGQYTYEIAVCEVLSSSNCDGSSSASVCQEWGSGKDEQKVLAGDSFEVSKLSGSNGGLSILSTGGSKDCLPSGNMVQIDIKCDASERGALELEYLSYSACKYTFTASHASACPGGGGGGSPAKKKGLSIGSILLIVCLVTAVLYLAAGVGWQYRKGERGVVALIPHKSFWGSIPGLTKDGIIFIYTKIRAATTGSASNYTAMP